MRGKVIYTCCVGGYDHIWQPIVIDDEFDYICFSNDIKEEKVGVWNIRPIPYQSSNSIDLSRYPKILPHMVLPDYEYSVYLDANIQIVKEEFYEAVKAKYNSHCLIAQVRHSVPPVDCIYDEISYAYKYHKTSFVGALHHAGFLKSTGFPRHYGLFENNLICRFHNQKKVIDYSTQWWNEFISRSRRDQFTLMYIYWKNCYFPECLFSDGDMCTRNSSWLKYHQHPSESQNKVLPIKERIKWHLHPLRYYLLKMLIRCL